MNVKLFIIWLFLVFLAISVSSKVFAYKLLGVSWPGATVTIHSNGFRGSNSSFNSAFIDALNQWNGLSNFSFSSINAAADPCFGPDSTHGWEFNSRLCGTSFGSATIAVAFTRSGWYTSSDIIDGGVIFNTAVTWDVHNGPGPNYDFRRVATHELGHAVGLDHDNTFPALMNAFYSETIETPQADDINGIQAIYGGTVTCTYSITPTSQSFNSSGGAGSVSVSAPAGCSWFAFSNVGWLNITSSGYGIGNGTVGYSVLSNSSTSSRTGTMTIASKTFTVTQTGITCTYSISPTSQSFNSSGGAGSVSVSAPVGCSWFAFSNASWITVTSVSSNTGNGNVNYSVSANTSGISRTGTIIITRNFFAPTTEDIFTVSQSGVGTGLTPPSPDIKANGFDGLIILGTSNNLLVNVSLTAGGSWGLDSDWWVVADTPFGWYHYDVGSGSWVPGLTVTYQGPLFDLPQFEALNISGLPEGTYTFYFAVDTNMNGVLDFGELFFDSVIVNITP